MEWQWRRPHSLIQRHAALSCPQMVKDERNGELVLLGAGSHAAVYLARLHGRLAAVKVGCTGNTGNAGTSRRQCWLHVLAAAVAAAPPLSERPRACCLGICCSALQRCSGLDEYCWRRQLACCRCLSCIRGWVQATSGRRSACCAAALTSALCRCLELRSRCGTAGYVC